MCVYMYVINNNITTSFFFHGTCIDTINSDLFFLFNVFLRLKIIHIIQTYLSDLL